MGKLDETSYLVSVLVITKAEKIVQSQAWGPDTWNRAFDFIFLPIWNQVDIGFYAVRNRIRL